MINAYDFDKTIYDGDSSLDFYLYCLKREPSIIFSLPTQIVAIMLYIFKIKSKDYMKGKIFIFLKRIKNIDNFINDFWLINYKKIKPWYLKIKNNSDVIISASPEFLLKPLENKLNIDKVIATKINKYNGNIETKNCHDYEKIKRYEKIYKKNSIKRFYTDSIKSDKPMLEYAKESYVVKKNKIIKYSDIKTNKNV